MNGEGHELVGLAGGVAEHQALVAGAGFVLVIRGVVDALGDVGGLGMDGGEDAAVEVEADAGVGVADLLDGVAGDLGVVDVDVGSDFAGDDDLAGGAEGLDGDAGVGGVVALLDFLGEDGVEDGVGDLVGHLVGVSHGDGFGSEKVSAATEFRGHFASRCVGIS